MGNWKSILLTGLALVGGWYLIKRVGGISGAIDTVITGGDPVAIQRFVTGAKAQADAAKAAALGGAKALADDQASKGMVKS